MFIQGVRSSWSPAGFSYVHADTACNVDGIIAFRPIMGVLCVGANCLIYLDQSSRPYGVALNEHSKHSTFKYQQSTDFPLALDCSTHAMLDPEAVLFALKTGHLCKMTLISEGFVNKKKGGETKKQKTESQFEHYARTKHAPSSAVSPRQGVPPVIMLKCAEFS